MQPVRGFWVKVTDVRLILLLRACRGEMKESLLFDRAMLSPLKMRQGQTLCHIAALVRVHKISPREGIF